MRHQYLFLSVFLLLAACTDKEPTAKWYKGNLHTHSYWSDGDDYPEMIMNWYKSNDYDFVGLSDHNIFQEGEKWKLIPKSRIQKTAFEKYLEAYGEEWVEWKEDTGRISVKLKTLEEYRSLFEKEEEFLILKSEEITDHFEGRPIHINATNIKDLIQPKGGNSVAEVMQNNINQVVEQRQKTGQPMFPHINHPNFGYAISVEDMIQLENERFFEVYNGHPAVHNEGDSLRPDTESMWDLINIDFAKNGKPLMFGLATDDSHNYHSFGLEYSNTGRGWVMVRSQSLSPSDLIQAMEGGEFYSSTGVILASYTADETKIRLSVEEEEGVEYRIHFIGYQQGNNGSAVLYETEGASATYVYQPEDIFIRVKITSDKIKHNPYQEGEYEVAWTQPILLNK